MNLFCFLGRHWFRRGISVKKLSFKAQIRISFVIIVCAFVLGQIVKMGIFHNIGWILVGSLFAVNPVWPEAVDWRDHYDLKKGIRIGGVLVIIVFGFLIRYGV